ncbi:MAG: PEP-utilizing enzyme [Leptospirales bacterium]|nr:PEP-utilizing enzyme [Leptospirales bacterium]
MENIIYFNKDFKGVDQKIKAKLGIRGRRAVDLAMLGLPIVPGFIIDSELTKKLPQVNLKETLKEHIGRLEKETKKTFGDPKKPLLLKVVLSSDLNIPNFPSIHNIGLNFDTVTGFAGFTNASFAWGEFLWLLRNINKHLHPIEEAQLKEIEGKMSAKPKTEELKKIVEAYVKEYADNFQLNAYDQLSLILKQASSNYCDSDIDVDDSLSVMIQAMVYGNFGDNSYAGGFYTRDIISGNKEIQGEFLHNQFDLKAGAPQPIKKMDKSYFDKFTEIAQKVEDNFREIRNIKFTIEENDFWLVEQREVDEKSTQSQVKTLLDLCKRGIIKETELIETINPSQLNELLHPVIDPRTIKDLKTIKGGISGSTGAAIGRVFFSTPKLLDEHKKAIMKGEDAALILVLPSSYAEDVKAIEVAQGVITTEGGFSSHAPVVARSIGKVAMVQPDMKLTKDSLTLSGKTIKEGEYISMNVPYYEEPTIYLGKVGLIEPDFTKNGLFDFVEIVDKYVGDFNVRANADQGREAKVAKDFKAVGIGLCRTEHMFFHEKRIMKFREMVIAGDEKQRREALEQLRPMQRSDFYDLFKIMEDRPVTIRLLDAPLHEFLPRTESSMVEFIKYMQGRNSSMKADHIRSRCDDLAEMNPMLGHRGCRVAVTYPEIYEMQCRAIFEAACMLKKEGVHVKPEIMIPLVMSSQEIKFIKNGKEIEGRNVKGINDVKNEVVQEYGVGDIDYKIGTMIELPAAALAAGELAQYAEFFSFGTNDLTQTTYGLSRDDSNSFFPDYSLFDLMKNNPFNFLGKEVQELIEIASVRGRLVRPDIKIGLCGEHGANPQNIEFLIESGLSYVSTSPYSIPLAKLSIAQFNIAVSEE